MLALQFPLAAQTNVTVAAPTSAATEVHENTAIIPVPRTGSITNRQALVLRRAKEAPGDYDIEFIGDSIMSAGKARARLSGRNFSAIARPSILASAATAHSTSFGALNRASSME